MLMRSVLEHELGENFLIDERLNKGLFEVETSIFVYIDDKES